MDLPTYTNIWRIEKRLYKLYDFRLPAPLPINWIAVFTGITVPYIVFLVAIGLPFNHSLVWLYVLPPGMLTWLTTRPVIESKRLPELVESQVRYLTEPRVWCRLAPLSEKDQVVVTARVWHSRRVPRQRKKAGVVAIRERGTLALRDTAALQGTTPAVVAEVGADTTAGSARAGARVRGKGAGASGAVARARSAEPRPAARTRSADRQTAVGRRPAATKTPPETRRPAASQTPAAPLAPAEDETGHAKPSWFRLAALGSRPAGPAPALPPGVALKPPPGTGPGHPADPGHSRQAGQAPATPEHPAASLGSVAAPFPASLPAHATPDVHPVLPVREQDGGAPHFEVSHGGPGQWPAPPASAPPANPSPAWPAPAWPHQPSRPVPQATAPATSASEPQPPAPVGQSGPRRRADLFGSFSFLAPEVESKSPDAAEATPDQVPVAEEPADPSRVSAATETETADKSQPATPQPAPVVEAVADTEQQRTVPSIERALSGPSKDRNLSWHGKVKIVTGAKQGPGSRDQEALDRARARLPLSEPKRVLMLGCTSGAGQTVTTVMSGHILASLREQPVAAVDLHDGALARYGAPAGWLEEILGGKAPERRAPSRPDGLHPTAKDTLARLDVIGSRDALKDGDERRLAQRLGRHYPLTMLDPGAAGLIRLLQVTDQLVVVVPASVEAAGALADTRDWLDAHGFADLATNSVTLINGVSRRSLADVAQAESVARGRCRAIVRVPWDDMVPAGIGGPSTLRPQTRVAYTALAGVLVAGMAAAPIRNKQ